jgi:hypothetical protein
MQYKGTFEFAEYTSPPNPNTGGLSSANGTSETTGRIVRLSAAQIASPTAAILADITAIYQDSVTARRYRSDGTQLWLADILGIYPARILSQSGIPIGTPSSGTIAANGALTLTTAMSYIYDAGIYLLFPANAVFAGSAQGFYYCVMSSTTVGTIFNNVYTSGQISIPVSPTAISAAGPGAYTQLIGSDIDTLSVTLTGGTMLPNGRLEVISGFSFPNNANNKVWAAKLGGSSLSGGVFTTGTNGAAWAQTANAGRQDRQRILSSNNGFLNATFGQISHGTQDTSTNKTVSITNRLTVATDYLVTEMHSIIVTPQA